MKEITVLSLSMGAIIGVVMTAANVYLGLKVGMTVSASIPAAVIAMGVLRGIFKRNSILEYNIVQTMASAGESLAAGIIFTLPALVLVGAWNDFQFWPTTIIGIAGGLLGVIFMIPLRRVLIVQENDLTYPEGVACSTVLKAGSNDNGRGIGVILKGLGLGALIKFMISALKVIKGEVSFATFIGGRGFFIGSEISPALLAIGYIVKLEVALLVFIGGALGWFICIPFLEISDDLFSKGAMDTVWTLWSTKVRYLGVGAMITGGLWSIISVRKGIQEGIMELSGAYNKADQKELPRTEQDISLGLIFGIFMVVLILMFGLYYQLIGSLGVTTLATVIMIIVSFIFVAVSSYIVGLVGSSNNPVSGMTISALLGTAALFLVLGFEGKSAILATLGVASIVCCAACTAGDCSQDLKTGHLVGASPRSQQIAQIIGVIIPAFVIAPVLTLLHSTYGIGDQLRAPQATLFASITNGLFGNGNLPIDMVIAGIMLGMVVIVLNFFLGKTKVKFQLHLMPVAVGIYLPVTMAVPMMFGALIRYFVDSKSKKNKSELENNGVLLCSGLIAGEAIMGIVLAVFYGVNMSIPVSTVFAEVAAIIVFIALGKYLHKQSSI
ncbi:oligopeptide transporter, OPT family [Bacteriovoracaceae bacterium]|nr:oligopeptide transporter, OPT family [Bacteriovoracaceae bacterium]